MIFSVCFIFFIFLLSRYPPTAVSIRARGPGLLLIWMALPSDTRIPSHMGQRLAYCLLGFRGLTSYPILEGHVYNGVDRWRPGINVV